MGCANRRDGPHEGPAVGVEHGQRPQVAIGRSHVGVHECADAVHPRIAMRDHHALRPRGRAAGVVDRQQVTLLNCRHVRELLARGHRRFIVLPTLPRPLEREEVADLRQVGSDAVDSLEVVSMGADDGGTAVVDDVAEVVRLEPVVHRHQHRAEHRDGVKAFEVRVGVGRDVGDAVALPHAGRLELCRPAAAAIEELCVRIPQRSIDERLAVAVETLRPAHELEGGEGDFDGGSVLQGRHCQIPKFQRPTPQENAGASSPIES